MELTNNTIRFGSDTQVLATPWLMLIALAAVAFIVWLVVGTQEPNWIDVLQWIGASVAAVIGLVYGASWHDVVIDANTRQVNERMGLLGYPLDWLGQRLSFEQFSAVLVEQEASKESEPTSSGGARGSKTVYSQQYSLRLQRANTQVNLPDRQLSVPHHSLTLPMDERIDPRVLEDVARQLSKIGGWPAKRRGYALLDGAAAPQSPLRVKSLPADAESLI